MWSVKPAQHFPEEDLGLYSWFLGHLSQTTPSLSLPSLYQALPSVVTLMSMERLYVGSRVMVGLKKMLYGPSGLREPKVPSIRKSPGLVLEVMYICTPHDRKHCQISLFVAIGKIRSKLQSSCKVSLWSTGGWICLYLLWHLCPSVC